MTDNIYNFDEIDENADIGRDTEYQAYKNYREKKRTAFLTIKTKDNKRIIIGYNYIPSIRIEKDIKNKNKHYLHIAGGGEKLILNLLNFSEEDIDTLESDFINHKIKCFIEYPDDSNNAKIPIISKIEVI